MLRYLVLFIITGVLGIGITRAQDSIDGDLTVSGEVNVSQMLTLPPQSVPPANPSEGSIYVTEGGELRIYFAGSWRFLAKATLPVIAPSDLAVNPSGVGALSITWSDNSEDETGFVVSYSLTGSEPWTALPGLAPDTTRFVHTDLAPGDRVYYRVHATGEKGVSTWTDIEHGQVAYSALFLPSELPSLSIWLDGKDDASITEVDGQVTQWKDKSGNNRHFTSTTTASGPTYGVEGLQFAQGQSLSLLNSAGLSSANGEGLVMVVHTIRDPASFLGEYTHVLRHQDVNSNRMGQLAYHKSTGSIYTSTIARNTRVYDIANFSGNVSVLASHFGDFKNRIVIDGEVIAEDSANFSPNADHYLTQIAGDDTIDIRELIIINKNTSTADRQRIEGYLSHKWGLAGQLPFDHPFRDSPPIIDVSPPEAPSGLSVAANGVGHINVSWIDNADDEIQFVVAYSDTGAEPWFQFPELGANVLSLVDESLSAEQTRFYRVKAISANGSSPWSEIVSATTGPGPGDEDQDVGGKRKKEKRKQKHKKRIETLMRENPHFKRFIELYEKKAAKFSHH